MPGLQKILLAEDNSSLRHLYQEYLVNKGFDVRTSQDGNETLEVAKEFSPELIFLDVMMPGINGFEVAKKLRSEPEYNSSQAKIIIMTNLGRDKLPDYVNDLVDGYALKAEIELSDLIHIIESFNPDSAAPPSPLPTPPPPVADQPS